MLLMVLWYVERPHETAQGTSKFSLHHRDKLGVVHTLAGRHVVILLAVLLRDRHLATARVSMNSTSSSSPPEEQGGKHRSVNTL